MSSKDRSFSASPGTVLSAFCLLLYFAGFIRNELKFGDYDQRLVAVEEVIPKLKEDNDETMRALNEGRMPDRRTLNLALIEFLNSIRLCYGCFYSNYLLFMSLQTVTKCLWQTILS